MKSLIEFLVGILTIIITIPVMLIFFVILLLFTLLAGVLSIPIIIYEIFTEKNN